jgi:hypothetical protein
MEPAAVIVVEGPTFVALLTPPFVQVDSGTVVIVVKSGAIKEISGTNSLFEFNCYA